MKDHRHTKVMRKRCVLNLLVQQKEVQFCWSLRTLNSYIFYRTGLSSIYSTPVFSFLFCLILKLRPVAKTCSVETLWRENDLSWFKSLLVTGLWAKILTSLLPPFKVVPPSFEHSLVLLATLIRGGGGLQAQDHKQAICAKIRYGVSSTFAAGCSVFFVT